MAMKNIALIASIAASLIFLQSCSVNPATGRQQFTGLMSPSQENQVGNDEHQKILAEFGEYTENGVGAYVSEVGRKVTARTERPDVVYKFTVLKNWSIVRTGTTAAQKSLFFNLRRLRAQIERDNGREGLGEEGRQSVAKTLNVNIRDVKDMEARLSANDQSLNATIKNEGEEEWQNFLADDRPDPETVVMNQKDAQTRSIWLSEALGELSDREQTIIRERHLGQQSVTLEDLGKQLGVSKERVRQLEQRAMDKLKTSMGRHVGNAQELFIED